MSEQIELHPRSLRVACGSGRALCPVPSGLLAYLDRLRYDRQRLNWLRPGQHSTCRQWEWLNSGQNSASSASSGAGDVHETILHVARHVGTLSTAILAIREVGSVCAHDGTLRTVSTVKSSLIHHYSSAMCTIYSVDGTNYGLYCTVCTI